MTEFEFWNLPVHGPFVVEERMVEGKMMKVTTASIPRMVYIPDDEPVVWTAHDGGRWKKGLWGGKLVRFKIQSAGV